MELEVKYKVESFPISEIIELGFSQGKNTHQVDKYFIVDQILSGKRTYLRLRHDISKNHFSFDLHQIISELGTEETEVPLNDIDDLESIEKMLNILGYPLVCEIDKFRTTFTKDKIKIVLDSVKKLGCYVEIEILGDETLENQQKILETSKKLKLQETNKVANKGYPDLLLEYIDNH